MIEFIATALSFIILMSVYAAGVFGTVLLFKIGTFDHVNKSIPKPDDDMVFYCSMCWIVFLPLYGAFTLINKLCQKLFEKK
jgi:hypothetical protein